MAKTPGSGEKRNVLPLAFGTLAVLAVLAALGWAHFQNGLEEAAKAVPSL